MKKRLHDKKAGIALLLALIILSVAEVIFRVIVIGEAMLTTANLGEQLAVIALAVTILILTAKGKDRACYLCFGAWAAYFVLDQLFELPGFVLNLVYLVFTAEVYKPLGMEVMIMYTISMIGIIAIGVLLVEYMNDGTIYNTAFNAICIITLVAIIRPIFGDAWHIIMQNGDKTIWLSVFNNLYRCLMIFMFTFFAYDSAKHQLKKANLSK